MAEQLMLPGGAPELRQSQPSPATIKLIIADVARSHGPGFSVSLLIRQCEAESSFRVDAHNKGSDCYGLFQLAAATAEELGVNRYDWRDNIVGGVQYMAKMLRKFGGDCAKALAAYNWGPGNLRKCVLAHGDNWRKHLPAETARYLTRILQTG